MSNEMINDKFSEAQKSTSFSYFFEQSDHNQPLQDSELKVGEGWRYQCRNCGRLVKIDVAFPEQCPGCGSGGWWGHLTPQPIINAENSWDKELSPIKRHGNNLSQLFVHNSGTIDPEKRKKQPGPRPKPIDDLVKEMASQGLSSRAIASKLYSQGISVSYKTVQRRLQAVLL